MTLTIDDLFTPAQSGVGLNPNDTPATGTWLAELLLVAAAVGLPTTAWQPGGPERTILSIAAVALAQEDAIISLMAQGGFLDFAAGGTVTTTALDGTTVTQPVTPDPSIPSQNDTGAPGWLDELGSSYFDTTRLQATYATGTLSILNGGVSTLTYGVGQYHVANSATSAGYSNLTALSVPPSALAVTATSAVSGTTTTVTTSAAHGLSIGDIVVIVGFAGITGLDGAYALVSSVPTTTSFVVNVTTSGTATGSAAVYRTTPAQFAADVLGVGSNAAPGAVTVTVVTNPGVLVNNISSWSASNYESNSSYAARSRLSFGARSPNGPTQAYEYVALTAAELLAAETPAVTLTNGPVENAVTYGDPVTGHVILVVSSTNSASLVLGEAVTPGCSQLGVTFASNATPINVTTASPHGLVDGDWVTVNGVQGNTAANVTTIVAVTSPTTFNLANTVGNGAYTIGGAVEGGDLGQVDRLIQANVVPDGVTAVTQSATAFPIAIVATVVVPQAYVALYTLAASASVTALLDSYPIGGDTPPGGTGGTVPISAIEGALVSAGVLTVGQVSYVREVSTLTLNGGVVDLDYPTQDSVALLALPSITVVGV